MVDIPNTDDVKTSVMEDGKAGLVGGLGGALGQILAGDVGELTGYAVSGAMVGGQNGSTITVSGVQNVIRKRSLKTAQGVMN